MKAKQVVAVILISASTAVATMWGYNHVTGSNTYYYSQDSGKVPSNYAKFFEGGDKNAGPAEQLKLYKSFLKKENHRIRLQHAAGLSGTEVCRRGRFGGGMRQADSFDARSPCLSAAGDRHRRHRVDVVLPAGTSGPHV